MGSAVSGIHTTLPDVGSGLAAVGLVEAVSNLSGDSLIDRLADLAVANTPLPMVEETIKHLGVTDKPFLRANVVAALALAAGLAIPGRRSLGVQAVLAATGLAVASLGRRRLDALEASRHRPFALPAAVDALGEATDGAELWPGAEPLFTDPERFYQTDINLRPPAVDADRWSLEVQIPGGSRRLAIDELLQLDLQERDAALVCVHNRQGWDRLGQQRWTGLPVLDVLGLAGDLPDDLDHYDLITTAVDGYSQVIPLATARQARTWIVFGMAGRALARKHGFPARVMTPGVVGQYNGVKWVSALRVASRGSQAAWWARRRSWLGEPGWPRELVWVKPMARIDSPGHPGMPPRLPPPPVHVDAGAVSFVGTAWAPPHGVAAVEIRLDEGAWHECQLARLINGDSWRRWRATLDLPLGTHAIEARCHSGDGSVQTGSPKEPFPSGAGAYHRVLMRAS